jgi:hypothetical protein
MTGINNYAYVRSGPTALFDLYGLDPSDPRDARVIALLCAAYAASPGDPFYPILDWRYKGLDKADPDVYGAADRFADLMDGHYIDRAPFNWSIYPNAMKAVDLTLANTFQWIEKGFRDTFNSGAGNGSIDRDFDWGWGQQGVNNFSHGTSWHQWANKNCKCGRKNDV